MNSWLISHGFPPLWQSFVLFWSGFIAGFMMFALVFMAKKGDKNDF
jgi:hypothetical protein